MRAPAARLGSNDRAPTGGRTSIQAVARSAIRDANSDRAAGEGAASPPRFDAEQRAHEEVLPTANQIRALADAVIGAGHEDEVEVLVGGEATRSLDENHRADLRLSMLGFVFQFHFLLPEFSALENVLLPMRALSRLKETPMRNRARDLLATLGLADHLWKRPDQLSGGQRQRVAIARALANEPSVILADEPTGNLDTVASAQVVSILRQIVDGEKKAVVIVTHDPGLAAKADRQIQIVDGRIASEGFTNYYRATEAS